MKGAAEGSPLRKARLQRKEEKAMIFGFFFVPFKYL